MRLFASLVTFLSFVTAFAQASCDGYNASFSSTVGPGNVAVFFNTAQPIPNGSFWEFGDGSSGAGSQIAHTYASSGTYTVCYTAWWWNELLQDTCWSTTCQEVVLDGTNPCDGLHAGFSFTAVGGGFQFSNTTVGTGTTTTWYWTFGDGATSAEPQPFHEFPGAGTYEVCLKAISIYIDDNGAPLTCVDTHCMSVTVQGGNPCDGLEACFVASDLGDGAFVFANCSSTQLPAQFVWNFGDGGSSTNVNAEHTYQEPGTYTVCLTAYWGNCVDSTCTTVVVEGGADPCDGLSAGFSWGSGGTPGSIFYTAITGVGPHWLWSFGDGTYSDDGPQGVHTYPGPGEYQLCLTVFAYIPGTQDTCSVTSCQWVTIGEGNPCDGLNAGFSFQTSGSAVNFQNTVVNNEWAYYWNFGDGTTGYGSSPVHIYTSGGVYHACLTVWTWDPVAQDTCFADHCEWVTVQGGNPCDDLNACFEATPVGTNGFQFTNCSTPQVGVQFVWHFGDGSVGSGVSPDHEYPEPGSYTVCLLAYWGNCMDSTCTTIVVEGGGNPCDGFATTFTWNTVGVNGAVFIGTTSFPATGMIWHFGDGTEGFGETATHTYAQSGQYHVCLVAWYWNQQIQDSCWAETCAWITVGSGNPCDGLNAQFSAAPTGFGVNFQNAVVNTEWAYSWTFGDGTSAYGPNPFHTYTASGAYQVCLVVWTWDPVEQDTCFADHCEWVTVQGGSPCDDLNACFEATPVGTNGFQFNNCTTPQTGVQFVWHFGDGSVGTSTSPDHNYQEPGTYTVCLIAYWQNCMDSTCTTITVGTSTPCNNDFTADFEWTAQGTAVVFHGTTNLPANGLLWFFGDGTTGAGEIITHLYEPPGPYNVCLAAWYWNQQTQDTCWAEHCESVDPFNGPNGIHDDPMNAIRIYPQPANDLITIDGLVGSALLRLFGADGRLVLQERSSGTTHRLQVADLASGVYVLHLDTSGRSLRYSIAVE